MVSAKILELSGGKPVERAEPSLYIPAVRGRNCGLLVFVTEYPELLSEAQKRDFQKNMASGVRVVISPNWEAAKKQINIYLEEIVS